MKFWLPLLSVGISFWAACNVHAENPQEVAPDLPLKEMLRPDSNFAFGLTPQEVEKSLSAEGARWQTHDRDEFLIRRHGEGTVAEERFLQRILAIEADSNIARSYWFEFASPLTHSELYLVRHHLRRKTELGGLILLADWSARMLKDWGAPHLLKIWKGEVATTYFLGPDYRPLAGGAQLCGNARRMFYTRNTRTMVELKGALAEMAASGCSYFIDVSAYSWKDGLVEDWSTSIVDMRRAVEDTRRRLELKSSPGK